MKRKSLPVLVLSLGVILALAFAGVAYGLWAEELTLEGTVETGEVDVGLSLDGISELVWVNGYLQDEPAEKAPAANCSADLSDSDPGSDGMETLTVTVEGAYPGWRCEVDFNVENLGTVPVLVHQPEQISGPDWVTFMDCYDNDTQLESGYAAWCTLVIEFFNEDGVEENSTYTFEFSILAHQWNEEP